MSILASVQRANIPTGTTAAVSITDATTFAGATPKAAIVIVTESGTAFTENAIARMSIGFMASNGQGFSAIMSEDASADANTDQQSSFFGVWGIGNTSGSSVSTGSGAFVTNGIELTAASNPSVSCEAVVYLFGGSGIADAAFRAVSWSGRSSPYNLTGFGFRPDLLFAHSTNASGVGISAGAQLSFGVAGKHQGGSIAQWSTGMALEDGASSSASRTTHNDGCILACPQDGSSTLDFDIAVDEFIDDGVKTSWTQSSTGTHYFLGLKLANTRNIHIETIDISAAATSFTSSAALQAPVFGLTSYIENSDVVDTVYAISCTSFSVNAYDGTNTEGASFYDYDGQFVMQTGSIFCSGAWGMIDRFGSTIVQMSYAFNGSDQTVLTETSNSLVQDGSMGVLMLGGDQGAIVLGTTDIIDVRLGSTSVGTGYFGSTELP